MPDLKVGSKAPDFTLPTGDVRHLSLKELRGKKIVLYFYPKDNTSGCTKEACAFRDEIKVFHKKGSVVVGVSVDTPESHRKFSEKFDLSFPLVSDEKKELVKKYGVWKEKSMYGRKYMGVERTTFLIDGTGTITQIYRKVKVDGHAEEVLKAL